MKGNLAMRRRLELLNAAETRAVETTASIAELSGNRDAGTSCCEERSRSLVGDIHRHRAGTSRTDTLDHTPDHSLKCSLALVSSPVASAQPRERGAALFA